MTFYEIQENQARGRHMVATQAIQRGTCILAETPLIEFHVGRTDRFDENAFWGTNRCSGAGEVYLAVARLSDDERADYDRLKHFKKTPSALKRGGGQRDMPLTVEQWECLSRAGTNVFRREYIDRHGVKQTAFTLLRIVACINHACRPNAIYQWDGERDNGRGGHGQGVVHALGRIEEGDEITISYLSGLDFLLEPRADRRRDLDRVWCFTCSCDACSDVTQQADDDLRATASTAYTDASNTSRPSTPIPGDTHFGRSQTDRHAKINNDITNLTTFIDQLKILGCIDTRLADAYGDLAEYHERYWEQGDKNSRHGYCQSCAGLDRPRRILSHPRCHLDKALEAYHKQMLILIICCGNEHEEVRKVRIKKQQLEGVRGGVDSPIMP